MRVTLQNIAEDTGLSISTVSRILSRKERKHTASESKVIESAQKLRYPFFAEMHSQIVKEKRIALVTEIYEGEFYSSLFYWFYHASREFSCDYNQVEAISADMRDPNFLQKLRKNYDGLCIFFSDLAEEDYTQIKEQIGDMPIVSLAPNVNPIIETISFDSYRGGHLAAKHFNELGLFDVGLITGPSNKIEANYRKNGFMDFINNNKHLHCRWTFEGDYSHKAGAEAYADLKSRGIDNLAIFASNDQTSFGFMKAAIEDGKRIPENYAVMGYDDMPFCKNFYPELSSVHTDFQKWAKAAMGLLKKKMEGDGQDLVQTSLIPVSIVARQSTIGGKSC